MFGVLVLPMLLGDAILDTVVLLVEEWWSMWLCKNLDMGGTQAIPKMMSYRYGSIQYRWDDPAS